jgi:putative flippase GtrA
MNAAALRKLLASNKGRYLIVGGSIYLLELVIIVVMQQLGSSPTWAVAVSFWVGTFISFLLQKFVTFGDKRTHHKVVLAQAIAVVALVIFNFFFTVAFTHLMQHHLPAVVSRTIALGITVVWNFYLYKTKIFTPSLHEKNKPVIPIID